MADRRATEIELDTKEGFASREKLHHHLNDQADLIQEIDSKLPVVQLALELTHKIFGSCPPMQSFDPAKMLTDYGKLQTLDITVACRKSSCKVTSTSVPPSSWTPRSQTEILQLGNLKPFSFNVLKLATRNFRLVNVLGEGGSGSVFKGWIDEQSVKRLNQAIFKVFKNGSHVLIESKVTSTSVPLSSWTPRSQTEILQLGNLKPFSFNVLKLATRNFRLVNVLGEGGSGSVFKGWIDEQSVKRLNQAIFKLTEAFGKFYGNSKQGTSNDKSHGGVHENCIKSSTFTNNDWTLTRNGESIGREIVNFSK
ncbi:unnamed protein product [Lactuca saligna]|uniref:Uncharacterized protein n=1 Tax=Lactuca saligna TaxID=75948 RepID=A0AA35ZUH5_LACSI|nr:unnamed protein product [Lactuca saligna]